MGIKEGGRKMRKNIQALVIVCILSFIPVLYVHAEDNSNFDDELMYSIMVDRFFDGDTSNNKDVDMADPLKFNGGDFQGIIKKLDYLQDMGFTAVQLSPIFANETNGYHGEWTIDYEKIEEHYGTLEDFKQLVDEIHTRNMKIIIEFPIDTVGETHPWVKDSSKTGWLNMDQDKPTLELENEDVQNYLITTAIDWLEQVDFDGYHLANVEKAPKEFLETFARDVKNAKKDVYLQATSNSEGDLTDLVAAGFNRVSDTSLIDALIHSFYEPNLSTKELVDQQMSANPENHTIYFDDKDLQRYTKYMADANEYPGPRWKLALGYLYTQPSLPSVYYASEIAINGGLAPENRPLMNFRTDDELIKHMEKLGKIRNEQPALRKGTMELLYEKDGMTLFTREYKDDVIVVAINNTEKDQVINISADQLEDEKELRGLFGSDLIRSEDGEYKFVVERDVLEIYKMNEKTGINYSFIIAIAAVIILFSAFIYFVPKRPKEEAAK